MAETSIRENRVYDPTLVKPQEEGIGVSRRTVIGGLVAAATALAINAVNPEVLPENQADKMAKYKPTRLFIGSLRFKVGSLDLHTEPTFEPHDYFANKVEEASILKLGDKEVSIDDEVELLNPLSMEGQDPKGPSGRRTTWFQVPNVVRRIILVRNRITGYAPLGSVRADGSFFDIIGEDEKEYKLKGHEPVPKDKTQVFKVNGK